MKNKKLLVLVPVTGAIAFCAYKLYKTVQKVKAEQFLELEVALEAEELAKQQAELETISSGKKQVETYIQKMYGPEREVEYSKGLEEEEELLLEEPLVYDDTEWEEEIILLYGINTPEVFEQFTDYKLAEISNPKSRAIVKKLYFQSFNPRQDCPQDIVLREQMIDERIGFFGEESIHTNDVSIGDLVMYFVTLVAFDVEDTSKDVFLESYLTNIGITENSSQLSMGNTIGNLVRHELVGNGFGMFGLEMSDLDSIRQKNIETTGRYELTFMTQYYKYIENIL